MKNENTFTANEGHIGVNESILTIMKQIWTQMNGYFLEMNSKRCKLKSEILSVPRVNGHKMLLSILEIEYCHPIGLLYQLNSGLKGFHFKMLVCDKLV